MKIWLKSLIIFAIFTVTGAVWAAGEILGQDSQYSINTASWVELNRYIQMPESMDSQSFTVQVHYTDGNQRTNIDQIELIDPNSNQVLAIDDHDGFSGSQTDSNEYEFPWASDYAGKVLLIRLRIRCDQSGNSTGYIRVSNGVSHYRHSSYSFGINFTGDDNENLDVDANIGFAKNSYSAPKSWINVRGGAAVSQIIDCDGNQLYVSCSAHGVWNSGIDVENSDFGKLTYRYLDDAVNSGRTKASVAITGLPIDRKYAVAVILSGDNANNTDYNGLYSSALVNGEVYSYVTAADDQITLVSGDQAKEDAAKKWGDRRKPGEGGPTSLIEGTNVMFIEGLSGSMLSITSAEDAQGVSRFTIAGVQVWVSDELVELPTPVDKEVISLNFAYGNFNNSDRIYSVDENSVAGLVSAKHWNNLIGSADNDNRYGVGAGTSLKLWNGESASDMAINYSFSSANSYEWANADDVFLKGYLDDGAHGNVSGPTINVSNIPFDEYSVIVYCATDEGNRKFKAININGRTYNGSSQRSASGYSTEVHNTLQNSSWGVWGSCHGSNAEYGRNALRVDGLSGDLAIQGGSSSNGARGGIAALQIVNTGVGVRVIDWTGKESSKISDLGDVAGTAVILKLSAGAELNFDSGFDCESLEIYSDGAITVDSTAEIAFDPKLIVNADITVSSETIRFNDIEIKSGKTLIVSDKNVVGDNLSNAGVLKYACELESLEGVKISNKTGFADLTYSVQTVNFPGTLVIDEGDAVSFNGTDSQRLSMPIEISGGELNLSSGNAGFWLGANGCQINQRGGTVKMLGANTQMSGNGAGLLLGWMGNGPTYNLSGGLFDVQLSHINLWNTTRINISGGELKTLGFIACNGVKNSEISLSGGGKLTLLGAQGVSDVLSVLNLRGGELSVKETCPVDTPVFIEGENAVVSVDGGKVLTVSGAVSGEGDFAKTESGILAFTGTLSEYSGTITLNGGKIKMPIDSGFAGEIVTDDPNMVVAKTVEDGVYVYKLSNTGFRIIVR